jgi:hypothetical protein
VSDLGVRTHARIRDADLILDAPLTALTPLTAFVRDLPVCASAIARLDAAERATQSPMDRASVNATSRSRGVAPTGLDWAAISVVTLATEQWDQGQGRQLAQLSEVTMPTTSRSYRWYEV